MDRENRGLFALIENYIDMLLNLGAAYIAFYLSCLVMMPPYSPSELPVVITVMVIIIFSSFFYQAFSVYNSPTFIKKTTAYLSIIKANVIFFGGAIATIALFSKSERKDFLIIWFGFALLVSSAFLLFKRNIVLEVIGALRKNQSSFRKIIVVGDNTHSAKEYVKEVTGNPECGIMVLGYVGKSMTDEVGCDRLGSFSELEKILDKYRPTDVVFAIDAYDKKHLIRLVNICDDRCVKVYFLPVIFGFFKSAKQIEQFGHLPLINIHNTPLDNSANALVKRVIDIVGASLLILITAPLMLIAAIGTHLSSPGPILFRQVRVGKLGKKFTMFKFRSMKVNDQSDSAWTTGADARKTKFGTFIRRTAIDELPQLFNVLLGHMSLVGPRPEIPKFVNEFKETIPLYMIKHYVKPGLTGLAQVKGLRGDTSVEERIKEDISYIEHWSLWLDITILFKTPFVAFNKNEKYIETEIKEYPELYGLTAEPEMKELQVALNDCEDEEEILAPIAEEGDGAEDESADANETKEENAKDE